MFSRDHCSRVAQLCNWLYLFVFYFSPFRMESLSKLVILLSILNSVRATSKPVLVRYNTTQQLYTSSLLTWESFNDPNQLKNAVVGGVFTGEEDVRFASTIDIQFINNDVIVELESVCLSFNNQFTTSVGLYQEANCWHKRCLRLPHLPGFTIPNETAVWSTVEQGWRRQVAMDCMGENDFVFFH